MTDDLLRLTDCLRARLEACAADPCLLGERDVRLALEEAGLELAPSTASPEAAPREDGTVRQAHYGAGRQPWDDIVDLTWAPEFAAGNVLKYLRRAKQVVHSTASARWYRARLEELCEGTLRPAPDGIAYPEGQVNRARRVRRHLEERLTPDERRRLAP